MRRNIWILFSAVLFVTVTCKGSIIPTPDKSDLVFEQRGEPLAAEEEDEGVVENPVAEESDEPQTTERRVRRSPLPERRYTRRSTGEQSGPQRRREPLVPYTPPPMFGSPVEAWHKIHDLYFVEFHNTYDHFNVMGVNSRNNFDTSGQSEFDYFLDNYDSYELDVYWTLDEDGLGSRAYVSHIAPLSYLGSYSNCGNYNINYGDYKIHRGTLAACMVKVVEKATQRQNDRHRTPIMLGIDVKYGFKQVNAAARDVVNRYRDSFFTPNDLVAYYTKKGVTSDLMVNGQLSLRKAVRKYGWPTVEELGTKRIIIFYTGNLINDMIDYILKSLKSETWGEGVGLPMPSLYTSVGVHLGGSVGLMVGKQWIVANNVKHNAPGINAILRVSKESNFITRVWDSTKRSSEEQYHRLSSFIKKGANIYSHETNDYSVIKRPDGSRILTTGIYIPEEGD